LANFAITVYAYHDGQLGIDCNAGYNPSCDVVFQGRAACYSAFLIVLMVHAFTCKSQTLSIFQVNLLDNKLLLAMAALGCLFVFPIVYIPCVFQLTSELRFTFSFSVINKDVFLVGPLTWEWGMVVASVLAYLVFAELYKLLRRAVNQRGQKRTQTKDSEMGGQRQYGRLEKRKLKLRMADTIPANEKV
jgi:Na+-exporting ATPase